MYKVTRKGSGVSEKLTPAQYKDLEAAFVGGRKVSDLYDVEEMKTPEKPAPLADEAPASGRGSKTPKADAQASA